MDTTKDIQENTLLPLVKGQSTYKLIVPEKVEEKIRYLIRKFPSTEWSGVLFYSHTGNFEDNDLVITCQDIYPMDLGTMGWTEFKMSEDVAAYMADNLEVFEYETGLIHSHHTMGAFFSSQDNRMLQQEGNDTNCFVSLVVDTRGQYVARITRKILVKSEVTVKQLGKSYEFFGDGTKELEKGGENTTKSITKAIIQYFDLDVERHEVHNTLSYLDERFDEIEKKKNSHAKLPKKDTEIIDEKEKPRNFFDWLHKSKNKESSDEINLFSNDQNQDWKPDPKKIHRAVVNIITCNLIINPDKFDLKQWVKKYMVRVYENIFTNKAAFEEWKDFIIQFTLDYFDTSDVPDELIDDWDYVTSAIATAIADELSAYKDCNKYIQEYYDALTFIVIN